MLCLYLQAPFAACRTFTAGWYRPTASFLTPSAAYGLALNIAGIESRLREEEPAHDGSAPATLTRAGLPPVRLALGVPAGSGADPYPTVQTIYQQLHNYPVGSSGQERAESAHGNKYNITPVRREMLVNLRAVVCVDGSPDLEQRIRRGLNGELNEHRYGIPFLGDNAFLLDRMDVLDVLPRCYWYEPAAAPPETGMRDRTTRLTIWIDRADLSRTCSGLFAPATEPSSIIPQSAWIEISPPPAEHLASTKGRKRI
jgi:CRISPR-associated protein Cas5t